MGEAPEIRAPGPGMTAAESCRLAGGIFFGRGIGIGAPDRKPAGLCLRPL